MNAVERKVVIQEFESYLKKQGFTIEKEVYLKKVIATKRLFRFDYMLSLHDMLIAIEINGGQWINGRHNRGGKGYENDLTKLNICAANNIPVFQFTYEMLMKKEYEKYL